MFLQEETKNKIKDFLSSRSGILFRDYDLKDLEGAISARMETLGNDTLFDYYEYLISSSQKDQELRELLNLVTVNHTYFFRNESQFAALKEKVIPDLIKIKMEELKQTGSGEKPCIRIWSAGCSTGEEPYSIAMCILDILETMVGFDIEIFATDVSSEVLDKARRGIYGKNSLKLADKEHIDKYFILEQEDSDNLTYYSLRPEVKNMVRFGFQNLMDEQFPVGFDIIFCRNVVIYFELETMLSIMNKFYSALMDDGYFFIGYSESLNLLRDKFKMDIYKDGIYYRKISEKVSGGRNRDAIKTKSENLEEVVEGFSRDEVAADLRFEDKEDSVKDKTKDFLTKIVKLAHLKRYNQALTLIEQAISWDDKVVEFYYLAIEMYLNQAKFKEARERIEKLLAINSLSATAYFLLGCAYLGENSLGLAKENFKKAIYLDRKFTLANFYLAGILKTEGELNSAIREYRNVISDFSLLPSDYLIAYSGGFNAASLISACKNNIEIIKLSQ